MISVAIFVSLLDDYGQSRLQDTPPVVGLFIIRHNDNMSIEIRDLKDGDLEQVRANPLEDAVKCYPDLPIDPRASYTALWDDVIVACGGAVMMWKGVWEFWLILTKDSKLDGAHSIVALEAIRRKIDEIIEENNIVRAQAVVRLDFPRGIRMLEALGFQAEGYMRKYTPDFCDVYRYARIK
jgi:hypothetical protein